MQLWPLVEKHGSDGNRIVKRLAPRILSPVTSWFVGPMSAFLVMPAGNVGKAPGVKSNPLIGA